MSPTHFQPATQKDDRRRSQREPYALEAWLSSPTAKKGSAKMEVKALNLSRHGVAFKVANEVATQAYHIIEIGVGDQRITSEIRTVSCRKCEDGSFEVGAEFF